jgi:hypothetical protein
MIADAVLGVGGVVGVGGSVDVLEVVVGAGAGVGVADHHRDGRAQGPPLEHAAEDLDLVGLVSLGDQAALARPPPIEVRLDVGDVDSQARRASVDHHADTATMALAEGVHTKDLTPAARHPTEDTSG